MHRITSTLSRFQPIALLILRVALGAIFITNGLDKFRVGRSSDQAGVERLVRAHGRAFVVTDLETSVGSSPLAAIPSLNDLPALIRLKCATGVNRWTALSADAPAGLAVLLTQSPSTDVSLRRLLPTASADPPPPPAPSTSQPRSSQRRWVWTPTSPGRGCTPACAAPLRLRAPRAGPPEVDLLEGRDEQPSRPGGPRHRRSAGSAPMRLRLVERDLPVGSSHDDVHVGTQRGRGTEQLVPVPAGRAVLNLQLRPNGRSDAVGLHDRGRPGERSVYLVWVDGLERTMFRASEAPARRQPRARVARRASTGDDPSGARPHRPLRGTAVRPGPPGPRQLDGRSDVGGAGRVSAIVPAVAVLKPQAPR